VLLSKFEGPVFYDQALEKKGRAVECDDLYPVEVPQADQNNYCIDPPQVDEELPILSQSTANIL